MSASLFLAVLGLACAAFFVHRSRVAVAEELQAKLVGRWQVVEGRAGGTLAEFTPGGKFIYTEIGGAQKVTKIGSYRSSGRNTVQLADEDGKNDSKLNIEFVSADSLICANDNPYCTFNCLSGRLVRLAEERRIGHTAVTSTDR
jgi:hypothetical protein